MASQGRSATASTISSGSSTLIVAATMEPRTRNPPACTMSWAAVNRNVSHFETPSPAKLWGVRSKFRPLPIRIQIQPTIRAVSSDATKRAPTTSGCPGNATAVEIITMGLMAGADSRKANAAAGLTPRRTRLPATGTEAHSQPGSTTPAAPAAGTAAAGFLGNAFSKNDGGTKAEMVAESRTPMTKNGTAWTTIDTRTVVQVWSRGIASTSISQSCPISKARATRPKVSEPQGIRDLGLSCSAEVLEAVDSSSPG